MSGWHTSVLEFSTLDDRDDLLDWFEANHPVEFPESNTEPDTYAQLTIDGFDYIADFALVGNYVYITCREDFESDIYDTVEFWDRAAYATFDAKSETCEYVVFFETDGEEITDEIEYDGVDGAGGVDILFTLTMEHQFRFRTYAAALPKTPDTFLPSSYDAVNPTEDRISTLSVLSGTDRTDEGIDFLEDDFSQTTRFAKHKGLESNTLDELDGGDTETDDERESSTVETAGDSDTNESKEETEEPSTEDGSATAETDLTQSEDDHGEVPAGSDAEDGAKSETDDELLEADSTGDGDGDEKDEEAEDREANMEEVDDGESSIPDEELEQKTDGIAEFLSQGNDETDSSDSTNSE